MLGSKGCSLLASVLAASMAIAGQALAEDPAPPPGGGSGGDDMEKMVVRTTADCIQVTGPDVVWGATDVGQLVKLMDEWKKNSEKRLRESLGASEEQWAVLQPRIEKATAAQQEARGQMRFRVAGVDPTVPSDLQKALEALKKLLAKKDAKVQDIQDALAAYREARAKAQSAAEKAQKELKELLTVRQEAHLVAAGVLE